MMKRKVVLLNRFELFESIEVACQKLGIVGKEQKVEDCCNYYEDNSIFDQEPVVKDNEGVVLHWCYVEDLEKMFSK